MSETYDAYLWRKQKEELRNGCSDDFIEGMVAAYQHTKNWMKENQSQKPTEPRRVRIEKIAAALKHLNGYPIYRHPSYDDFIMISKLIILAEDDINKFAQHGMHEWQRYIWSRTNKQVRECEGRE